MEKKLCLRRVGNEYKNFRFSFVDKHMVECYGFNREKRGFKMMKTFIKKQLHFKENLTVEINGKFNPNSYISEVEHGSVKDVACQSKNLNIKKLGKYEVTYTYKNR